MRSLHANLTDAAKHALEDIRHQVGGVRLARTEGIERAEALLEPSRILQIVGEPGVGKSAVLKHLAERLTPEGSIIVLAPGRIVPGGWLAFAHQIGCPQTVSREQLFNELGCSGGATLFIDNIDQIDDEGEWATLRDLLRGVVANPGWRTVVTAWSGSSEWQKKLPPDLVAAGIATLPIEELSDSETAVLAAGNPALSVLLSDTHPARAIARNLFHLSRLIELAGSEPIVLAGETDLARAWWQYGGGRTEAGKLARLKVLRALGAQVLARPGLAAFRADEFDADTIAELLLLKALREVRQGSTVTFRHDVLRDWTVGFLLDEEPDRLTACTLDKPIASALSRGLEMAARLAIEADPTGQRWLSLLEAVEQDGCHGSWRRPVLLALPRSERALPLLQALEPALLENKGQRLADIIRLMITVEAEPLGKLIARAQPDAPIPQGANDLVVPKGQSWTWLVIWLAMRAEALPSALIPDVAKLFFAWLVATQGQTAPVNALILDRLFSWLARIEEAMHPASYKDLAEAKRHDLDFPHARTVRDDIRTTCFGLSHLSPKAAQRYLGNLQASEARHDDAQFLLRGPGSLAKSASSQYVDFALAILIDRKARRRHGGSHDVLGPFQTHDAIFTPASPGQGPFFDLLEHAPTEGLRLVRGIVEEAAQWRRRQYSKDSRAWRTVAIPFPEGIKTFHGDFATYHCARSGGPSSAAASALMALEAWGHRQIESGRAFGDVLHDVLGPSGSSVAFLAVAADLALSHLATARPFIWPLLATPELLCWDHWRYRHDLTGANRLLRWEKEPSGAQVKRADLDVRASRRSQLTDHIGEFTLHGPPETLASLRQALQLARDHIVQSEPEDDDPIAGLRATAERALRMTDAQHWLLRKGKRPDGTEVEGYEFQLDPAEAARFQANQARVVASTQHFNIRLQLQAALLDPAKSTAEIVREGLQWAKAQPSQPQPSDDGEERDEFDIQWDRRATVMAAALAARDYDDQDRSDVLAWARPVLLTAASDSAQEYRGNDQIEYCAAALGLGYLALYEKEQTLDNQEAVLDLATHPDGAVLNALGSRFAQLNRLDPKLLRSLIRIVMATAIYPRRDFDDDQDDAKRLSQQRIADVVAAEKTWLRGTGDEPAWPVLPPWQTYRRRTLRIGPWKAEDEEPEPPPPPELLTNESRLGKLIHHLICLTIAGPPAWLIELASQLMQWTTAANGPQDDDDRERDHRPSTWNVHFFDFMGILAVALPHDQVVKLVLEPIALFTDEPFHDTAATFLRGFDRATLATDTRDPENPSAVRVVLADRIRRGRSFRYFKDEKSMMAETHFGDALSAMFYQPSRWTHQGKATLPQKWPGLLLTMPTLAELVKQAPASGYLATAFVTLIESSATAALLPHVVAAVSAWRSAHGVDANFWSDQTIGTRVCAWPERIFKEEPTQVLVIAADLSDELHKCLDVLVRSGVAQAREIEEQLAACEKRT